MGGICGILLAAGESRRMGYPKPLLPIEGETFISRLVREMLAVMSQLVVVLGAHADRVRAVVPTDARITIAENRDYHLGQLSSLHAALHYVPSDARAVLVHLVDHPTVAAATFRALIDRYDSGTKAIVIARYNGRRGHPVIFDRSLFDEIRRAPLEQGARIVVEADPARVGYVDLADPGVVADLDTPADLAQIGLTMPVRS